MTLEASEIAAQNRVAELEQQLARLAGVDPVVPQEVAPEVAVPKAPDDVREYCEAEIERLRDALEVAVSEAESNQLRGAIRALRRLVQVERPALAAMRDIYPT